MMTDQVIVTVSFNLKLSQHERARPMLSSSAMSWVVISQLLEFRFT
jgi:hypothetical protein